MPNLREKTAGFNNRERENSYSSLTHPAPSNQLEQFQGRFSTYLFLQCIILENSTWNYEINEKE